jgi:hypothetical protein
MKQLAQIKIPGYEIQEGPVKNSQTQNRFNSKSFTVGGFVTDIIPLILYFAVFISFIMLAWASLRWIFSGGNKEAIAKARSRITYALVGLAITFLALFLSNFVQGVLKPRIINPGQVIAPAPGNSLDSNGSIVGSTPGGPGGSTPGYTPSECSGQDVDACARGEIAGCKGFMAADETPGCTVNCTYYNSSTELLSKCESKKVPGCQVYACDTVDQTNKVCVASSVSFGSACK